MKGLGCCGLVNLSSAYSVEHRAWLSQRLRLTLCPDLPRSVNEGGSV